MTITTTNEIKGYNISAYLGLVNANVVIGANIFSDFLASLTDVFGGTSGTYQSKLNDLYEKAVRKLEDAGRSRGADAIVGVKFDFDEISGQGKSMFMVTAVGTAVKLSSVLNTTSSKNGNRFEIYQRLYDLCKFRDSGVITPEQYEMEKDNLLLNNENDIEQDLALIKRENTIKGAAKEAALQAKTLYQEQVRIEQERKAKELEERKATMSEKERIANLRKEREGMVQEKKELFKIQAEIVFKKAKDILGQHIESPHGKLALIGMNDVLKADYSYLDIGPNDKMAFTIGRLIKEQKLAEACKYYIDVVNDDDLEYAKSYINSIYDIITLKQQTAFESIAMKLIELKYIEQVQEAIAEFMAYTICSKEEATEIIEML